MARAHGVLTYIGRRGFKAGLVGDLPIDEAIAAVQEKRFKFDRPDHRPSGHDIVMLLDGLEVGSIMELHELVQRGRLLEEAHGGLLRALDFRAGTPEGLEIKADVREVLIRTGFTGPMGVIDGPH